MLLVIYGSLSLVSLSMYVYTKKNMNLVEILLYWFWTSILGEDYMSIIYNNLKLIRPYSKLEVFWNTMCFHLLLHPIAMIWFLHFYLRCTRRWTQLLLIVFMVLFLSSLQLLRERFGEIDLSSWNMWWSLILWFLFIVATLAVMKGFRWIKRREKHPV